VINRPNNDLCYRHNCLVKNYQHTPRKRGFIQHRYRHQPITGCLIHNNYVITISNQKCHNDLKSKMGSQSSNMLGRYIDLNLLRCRNVQIVRLKQSHISRALVLTFTEGPAVMNVLFQRTLITSPVSYGVFNHCG